MPPRESLAATTSSNHRLLDPRLWIRNPVAIARIARQTARKKREPVAAPDFTGGPSPRLRLDMTSSEAASGAAQEAKSYGRDNNRPAHDSSHRPYRAPIPPESDRCLRDCI